MKKDELITIVIILWLSLLVLILPTITVLLLNKFGVTMDYCTIQDVNNEDKNEN